MPKALLIVESPTKERTIGSMLGKDFAVRSSFGHIRDLPGKELGVDVKEGFEPTYVVLPKAKKIISELGQLAAKAEAVYLATDYDREGEAIAWHLAKALKLSKTKARRITFHEITRDAIREAVSRPRAIDQDLVNAQVARRVLDRLVGYRLSPLLWKKVRRGLSAGRVQSVAVRIVCAREEEIERFKAEEYWTLEALLEKAGAAFSASLAAVDGQKLDKFAFRSRPPLDAVLARLAGVPYRVQAVEPKERRRSPAAPFTTASLQQDAARRLRYSAARTMVLAQQLYEGIAVDPAEGPVGLITYMRTDSVQVAKEAQAEAAAYVKKRFGPDHLPPKPRVYRTKTRAAQEAHEAVRPTQVSRTPESLRSHLTAEQHRLYELIWQRFLASQMADAVFDTVTADIEAGPCVFRATGQTLKFAGHLAAYGDEGEEDGDKRDESRALPPLAVGDLLTLQELKPEQHFTEPPPRYNEASLVKVLEEHGIGRPSTYAPTLQTIVDRGYVRLEERRFYPTALGRAVDGQLVLHFTEIVDPGFTAKLEESLDDIAEGRAAWAEVVQAFYGPFEAHLAEAETAMERVEIKPVPTDEKCPACGSPMGLRENRYGRYLACSTYPACRTTIPVDRAGKKVLPQPTEEICPKCGKPMVMRFRGRIRFLACSGYPECKTTFSVDREGKKIVRPAPEPTDLKCEKCGRMMLKRVGRRGPFLACSGFPKCRNAKSLPD